MKNNNLIRPPVAVLLVLALAVFAPNPAAAQEESCLLDLQRANFLKSVLPVRSGFEGCCLRASFADAAREAVQSCNAAGVDNQLLRSVKSDLAAFSATCEPGGRPVCPVIDKETIYPGVSAPPPGAPSAGGSGGSDSSSLLYVVGGVVVLGGVAAALLSEPSPQSGESAFSARPLVSFQNDDGESLSRYGARIEYRRPDSPVALHWSAEEVRTREAVSASAQFGGEWRGEIWTFGGEAAHRDSRAILALRMGAALQRAGWKLRLDAKSAAWDNSAEWSAPATEILLGMEKAF